jgi:hypothetical protein
MANEKEALSVREAACYVGLAAQSLNNRRCRRLPPPYVKIGGRVIYLKSDLDTFLQAHRIDPGGNRGNP